MEISFVGKRALVTGASQGEFEIFYQTIIIPILKKLTLGIGREIVKALARCGAQVIAVSRNQEKLSMSTVSTSFVCVCVCVFSLSKFAFRKLAK